MLPVSAPSGGNTRRPRGVGCSFTPAVIWNGLVMTRWPRPGGWCCKEFPKWIENYRFQTRYAMNIECPTCGSTEFTKLSLVYAEGFSDLNASSRGWGLIVGSGGADLGFGNVRTKGQIQTRLSQRVSPPRKWSYWKILVGGLIGMLVLEFILGYIDTFLRTGGNFNQQLAWFGYAWLGL